MSTADSPRALRFPANTSTRGIQLPEPTFGLPLPPCPQTKTQVRQDEDIRMPNSGVGLGV